MFSVFTFYACNTSNDQKTNEENANTSLQELAASSIVPIIVPLTVKMVDSLLDGDISRINKLPRNHIVDGNEIVINHESNFKINFKDFKDILDSIGKYKKDKTLLVLNGIWDKKGHGADKKSYKNECINLVGYDPVHRYIFYESDKFNNGQKKCLYGVHASNRLERDSVLTANHILEFDPQVIRQGVKYNYEKSVEFAAKLDSIGRPHVFIDYGYDTLKHKATFIFSNVEGLRPKNSSRSSTKTMLAPGDLYGDKGESCCP